MKKSRCKHCRDWTKQWTGGCGTCNWDDAEQSFRCPDCLATTPADLDPFSADPTERPYPWREQRRELTAEEKAKLRTNGFTRIESQDAEEDARTFIVPEWKCENCGYDFGRLRSAVRIKGLLPLPYPWFGTKKKVVEEVWTRFGQPQVYLEPFLGGASMLVHRPTSVRKVVVGDNNAYICNFWRAIQAAPEEAARWCDWPVFEPDLHARHAWLVKQRLLPRVEADPEFLDAKVAGWWAWGLCCWLGNGWCDTANRKTLQPTEPDTKRETRRCMPSMGNSNFMQRGLPNPEPALGATAPLEHKNRWFRALQARIREVRFLCECWDDREEAKQDWLRVCCPAVYGNKEKVAVFMDPPYSSKDRKMRLYSKGDKHDEVSRLVRSVRSWCKEMGKKKRFAIALCGYRGEHDELAADGWTFMTWKAVKGYTLEGNENPNKEVIWFSPHCLPPVNSDTSGGRAMRLPLLQP